MMDQILETESQTQIDFRFQNGYMYKYYPGRLLNKSDVMDEDNVRY